MQLSDESLAEFVELWEEEFGEKLTLEGAQIQAEQLLELYLVLAQGAADYKP